MHADVSAHFTNMDWALLRRARRGAMLWDSLTADGQRAVRRLIYFGYLDMNIRSLDWQVFTTARARVTLNEQYPGEGEVDDAARATRQAL